MGIAQAGIAFRPTASIDDFSRLISGLCGEDAVQIEHPGVGKFDIRNRTDVMVQVFGDACYVCNHDVVWNTLEFPKRDASEIYRLLGSPELFMTFCHYDSGGSYGYALFENGVRTRSRLQTVEAPQRQPLIEYGTPKDFEQKWLMANFYIEEDDCPVDERQKIYYLGDREIEVPEYFLTKRILDETLVRNFGVCPWDTSVEPVYHFFRLAGKKKSWWRLW